MSLTNSTKASTSNLCNVFTEGLNRSCVNGVGGRKSVTEVGSSNGLNALYMASQGCQVTTYDSSALAVHMIQASTIINGHMDVRPKKLMVVPFVNTEDVPVESNPVQEIVGSSEYRGFHGSHVHGSTRTTDMASVVNRHTDLLRLDVPSKFSLLCSIGVQLAAGLVRSIVFGGTEGQWEKSLLPRLGFVKRGTVWIWTHFVSPRSVPQRCRKT